MTTARGFVGDRSVGDRVDGSGVGGGDALAAVRERSRQQIARYHEIREALESLRVRASSTDRSVTVELAAGGAIVDLQLSAQAMSKTPDTLARTILEAIRHGLAEVAERTVAEIEPLTGRRVDVSTIVQGRLPALDGAAGNGGASTTAPTTASTAEPGPAPVDPRFGPEEE